MATTAHTETQTLVGIGETLLRQDLTVGVDGMTCRFEFDALVDNSLEDWKEVKATGFNRDTFESEVWIPLSNRHGIKLKTARGPRDHHVLLNFNPSRVIDPNGTRVVSLDEAISSLEDIKDRISDWVAWSRPVDEWDLYRVDISVDVETGGATQAVLAAASEAMRVPRQKVVTYTDYHGNIETVEVRPKTTPKWLVYDKMKESGVGPPRVRFEIQMRPRAALRESFPTVGDLTNEGIRELFLNRFQQVAAALTADTRSIHDLDLDDHDTKTLRELVGYETLRKLGVPQSLGRSVRNRFERLEKKLGIRSISDILRR